MDPTEVRDWTLSIIEDHHPQIGTAGDDSTWLECWCGWDSSKPKAVDWHQHLVDALAEASKPQMVVTPPEDHKPRLG